MTGAPLPHSLEQPHPKRRFIRAWLVVGFVSTASLYSLFSAFDAGSIAFTRSSIIDSSGQRTDLRAAQSAELRHTTHLPMVREGIQTSRATERNAEIDQLFLLGKWPTGISPSEFADCAICAQTLQRHLCNADLAPQIARSIGHWVVAGQEPRLVNLWLDCLSSEIPSGPAVRSRRALLEAVSDLNSSAALASLLRAISTAPQPAPELLDFLAKKHAGGFIDHLELSTSAEWLALVGRHPELLAAGNSAQMAALMVSSVPGIEANSEPVAQLAPWLTSGYLRTAEPFILALSQVDRDSSAAASIKSMALAWSAAQLSGERLDAVASELANAELDAQSRSLLIDMLAHAEDQPAARKILDAILPT